MTGRERVKDCLEFASPDRPPRDLWALPYATLFRQDELDAFLSEYPLDMETVRSSPDWLAKMRSTIGQAGQYEDDWGSVWSVGEPGVIGEVKNPVLADWSGLDVFQPPWHLIKERNLDLINRRCAESDRFVCSETCARPFERMQFLRGTEELFIDIAYGSKEFFQLLGMVHEFYLEDIRCWCRSDVDGVFLMDDWGSNDSLLINPDTWRQIFKPLYREYCDIIHSAGKYVFFHTDGHTQAIFADFIEVGFDAVNAQLFCMDIEKLAQDFKGRVTFWGEIDRQYVLPFGTPEEVRQAVMRVRNALDDGTGGVIAQCEWGKNNPEENIRTVFDTWNETGFSE